MLNLHKRERCFCGASTNDSHFVCSRCASSTLTVARVLIALLFIVAGIEKIANFSGTVAAVTSTGYPIPVVLAVIAIILELGGGILLLLGTCTAVATLSLIVFTAAATIMFHLNLSDQMQQIAFLKNISIIGGLLAVFAMGPGAFALKASRKNG